MNSARFDLFAALSVMAAGLVSALVCFGLLSSQANSQWSSAPYSVSGALAGALAASFFTWTVLKQLRTSSIALDKLREENLEEIRELRRTNHELQQKLIQGAPEPDGFCREVDERQGVVMCRPDTWLPQSGSIFTFKCPDDALRQGDTFAAQMELSYFHIDDAITMDTYYDTMRHNFEEGVGRYGGPYRSEMITVGGNRGVPSLKLVARSYFRVVTQKTRLTGKVDRQVLRASRDDFAAHVKRRVEDIVSEAQQTVRITQQDATKAWDRLRHSRCTGSRRTRRDCRRRVTAAECRRRERLGRAGGDSARCRGHRLLFPRDAEEGLLLRVRRQLVRLRDLERHIQRDSGNRAFSPLTRDRPSEVDRCTPTERP